jgi:succinate dehydrogenase / fumarate reductase, cytochrome b subunit
MSWMTRTLGSSIGAKAVMAVTGLALIGFVIAHMLGNLLVFAGQSAFNDYAATLQSLGGLLWVARIGLLGAVALHIGSAVRLNLLNASARPVAYKMITPSVSSYATRTMKYSGYILFAFIVYHLLHFTLGVTDPDAYALSETVDGVQRHNVYGMVIAGFKNPVVSISYIIAMVLLSMHLSHGISSLFQSLGINHPKYNGMIEKVGPTAGALVALGFISIPAAVLAGLVS